MRLRFPSQAPRQKVILVAEDEPLVRDLVAFILEQAGYYVLTASDGIGAMEIMQHWPYQLDLLITDYAMPRMDGVTLSERVRAIFPNAKILMMSAAFDGIAKHPFMHKPFIPQMLLQFVGGLLA